VYGALPPVAASAMSYAVPTWPLGKELVVIVNVGGAMARVRFAVFVCEGFSESLT